MSSYTKDLISVIMPCFNAEANIENSILSVLQQTEAHFELIVVDDGSRDTSLTILHQLQGKDSRIKVFSKANEGAGPTRNYGLQHASGEFIAFLDSDDYWDKDFLNIMQSALLQSNTDLVYCGWQNIGLEGGRGEPFIPPDYENEHKYESFLQGCRWPIHGALTRHAAIDAVGGFDNHLSSCMDYDLWLKIATSHKIHLVPQVLSFYLHHEGEQITKNKARIAFNHWQVQKNFIQQHPDVIDALGNEKIRDLTIGELLRRGYDCYWQRDLVAARTIFKAVMQHHYGSLSDWKYMLPSLLPYSLHQKLLKKMDSSS
ncbi:glycosyltransferase family 2 protein [methanotrophic endosymbiont of Bathymodiolus puteoserpentis (Logatchev)]|uniref:glycosyltransferase family 2 protein n=1 Tax=methanotrophic endosymbiont of Bathymodiolus puteoserpentis (Logatchev) TaxID=343235 RepID=UPI00157ADB24|nr:glycosyltransferase [methanotrophic endosymbiont of Bathymodiolus puteoserpentis (Logatchev)]